MCAVSWISWCKYKRWYLTEGEIQNHNLTGQGCCESVVKHLCAILKGDVFMNVHKPPSTNMGTGEQVGYTSWSQPAIQTRGGGWEEVFWERERVLLEPGGQIAGGSVGTSQYAGSVPASQGIIAASGWSHLSGSVCPTCRQCKTE